MILRYWNKSFYETKQPKRHFYSNDISAEQTSHASKTLQSRINWEIRVFQAEQIIGGHWSLTIINRQMTNRLTEVPHVLMTWSSYIHPETSHKWRTMTRVNDTKNFGQARFRQLVLNIKMNHMQWVWLRIKINVISRPRGNFTWPEQRILIQFTDGFGGKKWREKINFKNLAGKFGAKKMRNPTSLIFIARDNQRNQSIIIF